MDHVGWCEEGGCRWWRIGSGAAVVVVTMGVGKPRVEVEVWVDIGGGVGNAVSRV